jgi:hypothetical protein
MNNKQYQKNILLELMNLDEFKSSDFQMLKMSNDNTPKRKVKKK